MYCCKKTPNYTLKQYNVISSFRFNISYLKSTIKLSAPFACFKFEKKKKKRKNCGDRKASVILSICMFSLS